MLGSLTALTSKLEYAEIVGLYMYSTCTTCSSLCRYTVFAVGNKTYDNYNEMGRIADQRLAALGAERVFPLGEGDADGK